MHLHEHQARGAEAAEAFNRQTGRRDGGSVSGSLASGLTTLRNGLYVRLHQDVERAIGQDSMLLPVSEIRAEKAAKAEIELFQVAVSADTVRQRGYVEGAGQWYVPWLVRLRFGDAPPQAEDHRRLADYLDQSPDQRRLAFGDVLARVLPESRRAPLVLFRLVPSGAAIATALAFGDHAHALELRRGQAVDLPAIADCHQCHAKLLENGEQCTLCGNPVWKYTWLTAP